MKISRFYSVILAGENTPTVAAFKNEQKNGRLGKPLLYKRHTKVSHASLMRLINIVDRSSPKVFLYPRGWAVEWVVERTLSAV